MCAPVYACVRRECTCAVEGRHGPQTATTLAFELKKYGNQIVGSFMTLPNLSGLTDSHHQDISKALEWFAKAARSAEADGDNQTAAVACTRYGDGREKKYSRGYGECNGCGYKADDNL